MYMTHPLNVSFREKSGQRDYYDLTRDDHGRSPLMHSLSSLNLIMSPYYRFRRQHHIGKVSQESYKIFTFHKKLLIFFSFLLQVSTFSWAVFFNEMGVAFPAILSFLFFLN